MTPSDTSRAVAFWDEVHEGSSKQDCPILRPRGIRMLETFAMLERQHAQLKLRAAIEQRGYRPVYHTGAVCPGCHRSNWFIGRNSAECNACGTALPLAPRAA